MPLLNYEYHLSALDEAALWAVWQKKKGKMKDIIFPGIVFSSVSPCAFPYNHHPHIKHNTETLEENNSHSKRAIKHR